LGTRRLSCPNISHASRNDNSADNAATLVTVSTETATTDAGLSDTDAGLAEVGLTAGLMSGQLSTADYQQSIAELAAEDADYRPIVVPPEGSP